PFLGFDGTSSYNSLQAQLTRRLSHGLQFGVAYTYSKALDYAEGDQGTVAAQIAPRIWNYGLAGYDRTHVLAINYVVSLPRLRRFANHALLDSIFNDWQLAGTTRIMSGAPLFWSTTTSDGNSNRSFGANDLTDGVDLVGGGDGWRPVVVG